ncbi:glycosyltransferase family 2 protein [Nanoarchaeota archaeon]
MESKKIVVSVVICTYNRKNDLIKCLDSIYTLNYINLEIILIDNNSTDNTYEEIKEKYPKLNIIKNSKNMGASYARNQGINKAQGKYIWFLDDDAIILNKDCLKNMLAFLEKNENTGALGGQIIRENNELIYWVMGEKKDKKIPVKGSEDFQFNVHYLPTCNCIMKRDLLLKLGGFDTEYFYLCEDLDIGLKIKNLKLNNIFKSDCCALHNFSQSQRVSNYFLLYKNLLRCLLINKS